MGLGACTYTSKRELVGQMEYFRQLASGWDIKTIGGAIIIGLCNIPVWYSATFGVSQRLMTVFLIAFAADFVLGIAQAVKTRWVDGFRFHKIWYKVVSYTAILMVFGAAKIILEEAGFSVLGLDVGKGAAIFAVSYLSMTDLVSCLKNVERICGPLPPPFPELIRAIYKNMSYETYKKIKAAEQVCTNDDAENKTD